MLHLIFGSARLLAEGLQSGKFRISPRIGSPTTRTVETSPQKSYYAKPTGKSGHAPKQKVKEPDMWESKANWKDPKWKYVPAAATDVAKTIERVKREMKALEEQKPKTQTRAKK